MNILWIKDNNVGHEKQVKVLLDELSKTRDINVIQLNVKGFHPFFTYVDPVQENLFDLIIGAGHKTYSFIIDIKKSQKKSCKTVAILTPSFNKDKFDLICAPAHDQNKFNNSKIWCAASTHKNEEIFLGKLHKNLKKNNKQLITIIIPRHINRVPEIIDDMNKLGLKTITHSSNLKIKNNTDIYLVDSYGVSSKFYNLTNLTFVGGSIINHGGQNPLEPARFGNFIINGPNVNNFREIYLFLTKHKMSLTTSSSLKMEKIILKKLNYKKNKQNIKKIIKIGKQVLDKNLLYINKYII